MTTYTADYIQDETGKWRGTLRADDTPDTVIETRTHDNWHDAACEVFELAGPDAEVFLGVIRGPS